MNYDLIGSGGPVFLRIEEQRWSPTRGLQRATITCPLHRGLTVHAEAALTEDLYPLIVDGLHAFPWLRDPSVSRIGVRR